MKFQKIVLVPERWETVEHETILSAIEELGVFSMRQESASRWTLTDGCDAVNSIELAAAHLRGLAQELIEIAEKDDTLRRARGISEDDDRIFPVMDAPPESEKP
jgi:hypothetical protein